MQKNEYNRLLNIEVLPLLVPTDTCGQKAKHLVGNHHRGLGLHPPGQREELGEGGGEVSTFKRNYKMDMFVRTHYSSIYFPDSIVLVIHDVEDSTSGNTQKITNNFVRNNLFT